MRKSDSSNSKSGISSSSSKSPAFGAFGRRLDDPMEESELEEVDEGVGNSRIGVTGALSAEEGPPMEVGPLRERVAAVGFEICRCD